MKKTVTDRKKESFATCGVKSPKKNVHTKMDNSSSRYRHIEEQIQEKEKALQHIEGEISQGHRVLELMEGMLPKATKNEKAQLKSRIDRIVTQLYTLGQSRARLQESVNSIRKIKSGFQDMEERSRQTSDEFRTNMQMWTNFTMHSAQKKMVDRITSCMNPGKMVQQYLQSNASDQSHPRPEHVLDHVHVANALDKTVTAPEPPPPPMELPPNTSVQMYDVHQIDWSKVPEHAKIYSLDADEPH